MPQSRSKYQFYQESMMAQRVADKYPQFTDYAGSDPKISIKLARLRILGQHGIINLEDSGLKLVWDLLNEERKAIFATSDKVNEITKMGLQMPKSENIISDFNEEE